MPMTRRSALIRPLRLLLADDTEAIRREVRHILAPYEASVEVSAEASDGESAVQKAQEIQPDIVVMDVEMPKLHGIEATRQITQMLPCTAVIGFSLHADHITKRAMFQAGAAMFIAKDQAMELPHLILQVGTPGNVSSGPPQAGPTV